jgi:hypothetical protein
MVAEGVLDGVDAEGVLDVVWATATDAHKENANTRELQFIQFWARFSR